MRKALTNYRSCVIAMLCAIVMVGLFSVPAEDLSPAGWLSALIITKLIALAAGWLLSRLLRRWKLTENR